MTLKKLHKQINKSSDRKILRQQMVLLAEYSRTEEAKGERVAASYGVLDIYRELVKTKCRLVLGLACLGVLVGLLYGIGVKFIKLFKSK